MDFKSTVGKKIKGAFLHDSAKEGSCGLVPLLPGPMQDVVLQLSKEGGVVISAFVTPTAFTRPIQTQFGVGLLPDRVISTLRQNSTHRRS